MSYKWLTAREHALERPDTIVGAVTPLAHDAFVFEHTDAGVTRRDVRVEVSPALLKLSDEIIVNAIDNHRRDPRQKFIRLTFESDGVFSVTNDGRTIPIERWDGVDRSNGYEANFFKAAAQARSEAQQARQWAQEDM